MNKEYGYLYNPPDAKKGDEIQCESGVWVRAMDAFYGPRRRLIQPGEGFEIVEEKVVRAWQESRLRLAPGWEVTFNGLTWQTILDQHRTTILAIRRPKQQMEMPPTWLPISQCDLKPGEAFWFLDSDRVVGLIMSLEYKEDLLKWLEACDITHFLRATGQYSIPKPPVVEKEDNGFEEWRIAKGYPANCESTYWRQEAWLASRAALDKGKDEK